MKTTPASTSSTRRFSRRNAAALLGGVLALGASQTAEAAYGINQIPTQMSLTLSQGVARAGNVVTARARITRVDNGAAVQSAAVNFYFGSPTFPNSRIGTAVYTDRDGYAVCRFTISQWITAGRNVVMAEFTGNNIYAQPLPTVSLTVQ